MNFDALVHFLDELLNPKACGQDTGLRISAAAEVHRVGAAVNLSFCAIEQAKHRGCDLLLTHHDAWDSTDADLVDRKYELLRRHNISLYVSHDPLDHHPEFGTSIVLARTLGCRVVFPFLNGLGVLAEPPGNLTPSELSMQIAATLTTEPELVECSSTVGVIGVIAGAGARPQWMAEAKAKGAATILSGEWSVFGKLYAKEAGLNLILAGHYATELPAVRALLAHLAHTCDVETELIDDPVSAALESPFG